MKRKMQKRKKTILFVDHKVVSELVSLLIKILFLYKNKFIYLFNLKF